MQNETKPILTVIVTSYNQKGCIRTCLESIFSQQTDFSYDVLIADDASTDGTVQMLQEKYGDRVRIIERKTNLGLCRNIYDAFMRAEGKYIYYCQGDDYLPTEHVFEKMVRYLDEHKDIFSVTGWFEIYKMSEGTKKTVELPYEEYTFLDFLRGKKILFYTGMMRNTFKDDKPKYFCHANRNSEEVQIWYYTLTKSKKAILPERVYTYCYRNDATSGSYNATHNYLKMLEDYAKGFEAVEKAAPKKYNYDVAKMVYYSGCIDYHIQNNGLKSAREILGVLKFSDVVSFVWIKLLMKLNRREIPAFLLRESRLIR